MVDMGKKKQPVTPSKRVVLQDGSTHDIVGENDRYIFLSGRSFRKSNPIIKDVQEIEMQTETEDGDDEIVSPAD